MVFLGNIGDVWSFFRTMPGPDFLEFYGGMGGAVLVVFVVLYVIVFVWPGVRKGKLDACELGFLVGGPAHAVHTALVSLKAKGWLAEISPRVVVGGGGNGEALSRLESGVLRLCGVQRSMDEIVEGAKEWTDEMEEGLIKGGYLARKVAARVPSAVGLGLLTVLMAAGGVRVYLGVQSGKPYEILVVMLIVSVIFWMVWMVCFVSGGRIAGRRTLVGASELRDQWKLYYKPVMETGLREDVSGGTLTRAFALFGPVALAGVAVAGWPMMQQALAGWSQVEPPSDPNRTGGGGCGSGGGDGGGSGCGGGGGCGGGD